MGAGASFRVTLTTKGRFIRAVDTLQGAIK